MLSQLHVVKYEDSCEWWTGKKYGDDRGVF